MTEFSRSGAEPVHAPSGSKVPFGISFVGPLALGSALNPVNSTMISTALVPIAAEFHTSVAETGWLIAALYLTSAVAQPTAGRLADIFGPRRVYLVSLVFVAIAGVVGLLAPSLDALVAARVLLGLGTSGAYPAAIRLFREQADRWGTAPPRGAMAVLSMSAITMSAIGPFLGGVLTALFGWHAIFSVNIPLAAVTMLLVLWGVPRDRARPDSGTAVWREIDMPGIALFAGALLGLMIFLMNADRPNWLALAAALGLGTALVAHSARRARPFIDVRMLARNRPLCLTYLRTAAILTINYSIVYGFAQWLENAVGLAAATAGLVTLPMSIVAGAASFLGARTRSIRAPFVIGSAAALAGCVAFAFLDAGTAIPLVALAVALFGLPQGTCVTATQAAIYVQAPAADIGTAAGLQRTAQYIGAMAATILLGLAYGQHATTAGLHRLALMIGAISAALVLWTALDRTLPRFPRATPVR